MLKNAKKCVAIKRAAQSPEEKTNTNAKNCAMKVAQRAAQSPEERKIINAEKRMKYANQSEDERRDSNMIDCLRKSMKRTSVEYKEALRSDEILEGSYKVPDLKDTPDSIGSMEVVCQYCSALKFKKETASSCCSD